MAANIHTFTIGERQFQMFTLQPFAATQHALKLKKIITGGFPNGLDSNIIGILEVLDEKTLKDIIFPILAGTQLTCTSAQQKLQSPGDMDQLYSVDDLDEFFLAVWEVLKVNFGPFFQNLAKRLFGLDLSQIDTDKIRKMVHEAVAKVKKENSEA